MTRNEIFRTAFKHTDALWKDQFGNSSSLNTICIYCKAGSVIKSDIQEIQDEVSLAPFKEFYCSGENTFKAYKCTCCNAVWSVYKPKGK